MIAREFHSINNLHLSLLCLLQLLPSIVAAWLRKHNVRTARRSGSVVLRPRVKWSRGRSRDPGSVFGHIITNRKSLQASHTGPLPPFVYRGGAELNSQRQSCTNVCCSSIHFAPLTAAVSVPHWMWVNLLSWCFFTRSKSSLKIKLKMSCSCHFYHDFFFFFFLYITVEWCAFKETNEWKMKLVVTHILHFRNLHIEKMILKGHPVSLSNARGSW